MSATPYDITEHKHRFSAWAASRAASTKTCRFDVITGKRIIEEVGLRQFLYDPDALPSPAEFDAKHSAWRELAIDAAKAQSLQFSHGISAKLINCYLKAGLVCGGFDSHPKVMVIHPPIDALLLDKLFEAQVGGAEHTAIWATTRRIRWSKLGSAQYDAVIRSLRAVSRSAPLWKIEANWRGYQ